MLAVWRARAHFDPRINDNFRGYAYRHVVCAFIKLTRGRRWQDATCDQLVGWDQPSGEAHPGESIDHRLAIQVLRSECIPLLRQQERYVVVRLFLDGASWEQVAQELGWSIPTIGIIRRRALVCLRTMLRERGLDIDALDWQ